MNSEEISGHQDWWGNFRENQQRHINEGPMDVKRGRIVSSKDFWDTLRNGRKDDLPSPNTANY
jgi:hypothetical protein